MPDIGLLLLRLFAGGTMIFGHGWGKLINYSQYVEKFADPYGLMPNSMALSLAIFAEVVCAALLVLGLFSRLALIPLMVTMSTAFFIFHSADPFGRKELSLLYLGMFLALFFTGPGRYSVQEAFGISAGRFHWLFK